MAASLWVDNLVTCGLTACTLGSTPGPTLKLENYTFNLEATYIV